MEQRRHMVSLQAAAHDERFKMSVTNPERDAVLAHAYMTESRKINRPIKSLLSPNSTCNVDSKLLLALKDRFKDPAIYH